MTDADAPLRDRVLGLEYNMREQARGLGELRDRLRDVEQAVQGMTKAEEIAEAVSATLDRKSRDRLTVGRKLAGALAAAVLLVPALHDAVTWFG